MTGTAGDDMFTIGFGGTDPAVAIFFDGAAGIDSLTTRGAQGLVSCSADAS